MLNKHESHCYCTIHVVAVQMERIHVDNYTFVNLLLLIDNNDIQLILACHAVMLWHRSVVLSTFTE
jgi:hypothetical protein